MDIYEQADKELAELLGWTGIHLYPNDFAPNVKLVGDIPNSSLDAVVPRWTLDDGECFRLMVEHTLSIERGELYAYVDRLVGIEDHTDKCNVFDTQSCKL